jgi:hypothetical protein
MWNNYDHRHIVLDKRRKVGFLSDKDFNFSHPPWPRRELTLRSPRPRHPSSLPQDDSEDYVASVFHAIQMVQ